jgi:hypothetical protein
MQWGHQFKILLVDVCVVFQQELDDGNVTILTSDMERTLFKLKVKTTYESIITIE